MIAISKGATVSTWTGNPTRDPVPWSKEGYRSWANFESRTLRDFCAPAEYDELVRANPWVFTAVVMRSSGIARLPFRAFVKDSSGDRQPDIGALSVLLTRPHPQLSMKQIVLWLAETMAIHGRAYLWIRERRLGRPVLLQPLHPSLVTANADGSFGCKFAGHDHVIPWTDMVPFFDNAAGISPLEPLRVSLQGDADAQMAQSSHWKRGARPGLIVQHPGKISEAGTTNLRTQINELYSGPQNAGRAMLLQEGMTVSMMNFDALSAAYIDSRKLTREEVAAAFRMPAPVLGILENATLANVKELYYALYRDVLAPIAVLMADAFNYRLVQGPTPSGGMNFCDTAGDHYLEFSFEEALRGTPEAQMESLGKQIQSGLITPNEGRKALNRPPEPGGDRLLINGALVPLELAGANVQQQLTLEV